MSEVAADQGLIEPFKEALCSHSSKESKASPTDSTAARVSLILHLAASLILSLFDLHFIGKGMQLIN